MHASSALKNNAAFTDNTHTVYNYFEPYAPRMPCSFEVAYMHEVRKHGYVHGYEYGLVMVMYMVWL